MTMLGITLDQIKALHQSWANAVVAQNIDEVMKLYSRDAVLKPTLSSAIRRTPDDIQAYFVGGKKFEDFGFFKNQFCSVRFKESAPLLVGNIAIETGEYEFLKQDGSKIEAHYTFCYQGTGDGKVLILTQHSSLKT